VKRRLWTWLALCAFMVLFWWFVYPTPWVYVRTRGLTWRTHRLTGRVQYFAPVNGEWGWHRVPSSARAK